MRKLLTSVLVLLVLLLAADRVGAFVASGIVAEKLKAAGGLSSKPSVSIKGFPFLTQAVDGRYDRVEVSAKALSRGGVRLARLSVTVLGSRIPLRDALSSHIRSVPVEGLAATAVVQYADIAGRSKVERLSLRPVAGGVQVTGRLLAFGQTVTASTVSTVTLEGRNIVITARSVEAGGQSSPALNNAIAGRLDQRVPVGTLPYGLRLTDVRVTSAGLVLSARTGPTVLTVP